MVADDTQVQSAAISGVWLGKLDNSEPKEVTGKQKYLESWQIKIGSLTKQNKGEKPETV